MTRRRALSADDARVCAAKLREFAKDLRDEAATFERCRDNTRVPGNVQYYASEYTMRVALAGALERGAEVFGP